MTSPVQQIIEMQQLTGAAAMYYTSPVGVWTQIISLGALNVDTAVHSVTIYIVPNGSVAGASTLSTQAFTLLPGQNYNGQNEYGMVLNPSDAIWALADAGSVVNIQASGLLNT
jgi:hypothetical protein